MNEKKKQNNNNNNTKRGYDKEIPNLHSINRVRVVFCSSAYRRRLVLCLTRFVNEFTGTETQNMFYFYDDWESNYHRFALKTISTTAKLAALLCIFPAFNEDLFCMINYSHDEFLHNECVRWFHQQ